MFCRQLCRLRRYITKTRGYQRNKRGGARRQRVDLIYNSKQYQMICELWVECTRLRLTNDELEKIPANVNAGAVLV